MANPIPPSFVMGNPPSDPGVDLLGYMYLPDVNTWGPGPYPGVVLTRAGGFDDGGAQTSNSMAWDLTDHGYICMFFDIRLILISGQHGLPNQTTDGCWAQQTDDCAIGMRYMRSHPLCNGFVAFAGGSGSGGHAATMGGTGILNDTRPDAVIALSGMLDGGDREADANAPFIQKCISYYLRNAADNPALITSRSAISFVDASYPPIYFANGQFENMPFSVATRFKAALDVIPFTNYVFHINTDANGTQHSFGTYKENGPAIKVFLDNAVAAWNGGGGGGGGMKPQPRGLYDLLPAPDGHISTTGKKFLTDPSIDGARARSRWIIIQPDADINTITGVAATDIITSNAHGYVSGNPVILLSVTGGAGLIANTTYYVRDVTTNTFKLAATSGGTAINFTTDISAGTVIGYDWTEVDNALNDCKSHGKKMGLSIGAGVGTPAWVYASPTVAQIDIPLDDQTIEGGDHMPAFWETGFMTKFQTFIEAMADKYEGDPFISYVCLTGFMQMVSLYFLNDDTALAAADLIAQADGYIDTEDAFVINAKILMDKFVAEFPTTSIILTIDEPFSETQNRGPRVQKELTDYGRATYGDQFGTLYNGLQAVLPPHDPPAPEDIQTYPLIGQPIHQSSFSGGIYHPPPPDPYPDPPQPLEDCLLNGWHQGKSVIEIYESDVNNSDPAFQAVRDEVHALLVPGLPPPPLPPFISSFTPTDGRPGDHIDIRGGNFTGTTSVLIGGVASGAFTVFSDTNIDVVVSDGAVSGPLTVVTPDGQAVSQNLYTVLTPIPDDQAPTVRSPILKYPIGGRPPVRKTKPDPPRSVIVNVSGIAGDTTATASWLPPLSDGGSPLTNYEGQVNPGPGGVLIAGPDDLTADIIALPLDSDQTFSVFALNTYGTSDAATFDFRTNDSVFVPPPVTEPRGVFRLLEINPTTLFPIWDLTTTFWNKSYIDGSRYEARWDKLVPAYDATTGIYTYDWADLDGYLDKCDTFGKKAIISIANGIYAPQWLKTLAAFKAGGSYQESGPDTGIMAYPWGQTAEKFWFDFLKVIGVRLSTRTNIAAIVATGFGQVVDTILSQNSTDTAKLTLNATHFNYASAADAWLDAAERALTTYNSAFLRSVFISTSLELPVPTGTAVKDGDQALDDLSAFVLTTLRQRMGFMCRGITAITLGPNPFIPAPKKIELVFDNSGIGFSAGYRLLTVSTDVSLDPSQDPASYDPTLAFTRAITKASNLQGKFVEIFAPDADNLAVGYVTAMTNAQTALALNP